MKTTIQLLQDSPFFEAFDRAHLERLADHARLESFDKGQDILEEGRPADALFMLLVGKVRVWFRRPHEEPRPGARTLAIGGHQVLINNITEPGRPVGWSAMVEPYRYRASATAVDDTQMLVFDRQFLQDYCEEQPDFGVALMRRILWVLGNRLRDTRIRLVAHRYEQEIVAIRALLDQSAEVLSVTSALHKIPHYLESRLTLSDAFHTLELLQVHGDEQERPLAALCLEILDNVGKEMQFYQRLQRIYELVANAPPRADAEEVRRQCAAEFAELFTNVDYILRGEEYLPPQPGHIFIMNHLCNHPENTLPNDFQLTLDTHFVSAVLLRKYGDAPIRVVRKSRPDEYRHQQYYERLGYIYVYHGHVDEAEEDPQRLAEERRRYFLETARAAIRAGKNVIICPEGDSAETEQSPLPFRAGAFRLASYVKPEPLLVPIAVANFDKKITRTRVAATIHRPFHLSEFVPEQARNEVLYAFINSYRDKFRQYVREAVQLASDPTEECKK